MNTKNLERMLLPDVCIGLRMALNGGAEPVDGVEADRVMLYLEKRLQNWRPTFRATPHSQSPMDEAVRALCVATLWECADLRKRLPHSIGGYFAAVPVHEQDPLNGPAPPKGGSDG